MADTTTPNIKITNQTEGGNNNSWGQIADANFEEIDDKFGDVTSLSVTGGTTTLSDSQEIVNAIVVTGTLVSNHTIVFSGRGGSWVVKNGTTGDFTLTCKVTGQTGCEIEQGSRRPVYCTGTDIEHAGGSSSATSIPTGFIAPFASTTAPTGWVRCNGRTIGNASSSSTERANADTSDLFLALYAAYSNSVLAIQNSDGTAGSRTTAAADYALNKRLPLPDFRGRALFGLDDMGNSAASRLTSASITGPTTNGSSGGAETTTLSETHLAAHTHGMNSHTHSFSATSGGQSATHTHTGSGTTSGASVGHTHDVSGTTSTESADHTHTGSGTSTGQSATHTHTGTTGNNSASHTHTGSGTSSGQSITHTHSGTTSSDGAHTHFGFANNNAGAVSAGNLTAVDQVAQNALSGGDSQYALMASATAATVGLTSSNGAHTHTMTTGNASGDHTHTYSFTTSTNSADHTHTFTTAVGSADHTHNYSFTTSGRSATHTHTWSATSGAVSADHTHTYSFTTAVGSADHTHSVSGTTGAASGNTASTGSGTAFSNLPPAWLITFIIKL
jgi:hypothetical protein